MPKCSLNGCNGKVIGGFQEIIDAGNFQDPTATHLGLKTVWCKDHKDSFTAHVSGKHGRYLTAQQLEISERA